MGRELSREGEVVQSGDAEHRGGNAHHRCRDVPGFVYLISGDPAQIVTDYRRLRRIEETQL
ncbi:hypothetical protein ACFYXH_00155 [Streptomyces sp. NPDC002730]|uniref:hypothetical protein n=1 Tax=Streptomyces sp. NPDC002730 TaxID=3364662 RepID=UPI0036907382